MFWCRLTLSNLILRQMQWSRNKTFSEEFWKIFFKTPTQCFEVDWVWVILSWSKCNGREIKLFSLEFWKIFFKTPTQCFEIDWVLVILSWNKCNGLEIKLFLKNLKKYFSKRLRNVLRSIEFGLSYLETIAMVEK